MSKSMKEAVESSAVEVEDLAVTEVAKEYDEINTSGIDPLDVPEEEGGDDGGDGSGEDCNFAEQMVPEIRKPRPFEQFLPHVGIAMKATLLALTQKGSWDQDYFWVHPSLRREVRSGIKNFTVLPWWSFEDHVWCLWLIGTGDNKATKSLRPLLEQPASFYEGRAFTVEWDAVEKQYHVFRQDADEPAPPAPSRSTSKMLGQAIGAKNFVKTVEHKVYAQLTGRNRIN
jgi:hypothetical protein